MYAQNNLFVGNEEKETTDTSTVARLHYYKTAEIAYEIENVNRYIKDNNKQVAEGQNISEIDSAFSNMSARINESFNEFNRFDKQNLSKFFLLNQKRVWLSFYQKLTNWHTDLTKQVKGLMEVAEKVKEKEKLWRSTANQPGNVSLPKEINERIFDVQSKLSELENNCFEVVGELSSLDSRIIDQMFELDRHIEIIDDLHTSYRENLFKATQPAIWDIGLNGSFKGDVNSRLKKAWYDNTKSLKDSFPSYKEYVDNFIIWGLLIVILIISLRYYYFKQQPSRRTSEENNINELVVRHPRATTLFLVLFVFVLLFKNVPLSLSGIISFSMLVITYFLLRSYISVYGRRLILSFIILLLASLVEIFWWYFGDYARLYLLLEAVLGMILISHFMGRGFKDKVVPDFRYKFVIKLLRYPVFLLYAVGFIVNLFGFQNLTVLLQKIATQASYTIIIITGAWEISKSSLYTLFEILTRFEKHKLHEYFPLLKKRMTVLLGLFFGMAGFHTFLSIVELDTPFYDGLDQVMSAERHVGSFIFSYGAIFQFIIIMLITWGLTSLIKIAFSEGNFRKIQRLRGIPAAISITLRVIIALAGFLLALSGAGIDLTKISIMLGAFSVGIGFGLQNIVNNFISGLILIYERPIQAGDTIEINTLLGEVKSIGIRSSNVRTFDGAEVVVPNSVLVSDQLINWTLSDDKRRIEILVGVKYGTDPAKVIEVLKQVAGEQELVEKKPEPLVLFKEFADSSLNFRLLCWVLFGNGIQAQSDLSVAIDKAFKANNIEIPFPQLDLHVVDNQ